MKKLQYFIEKVKNSKIYVYFKKLYKKVFDLLPFIVTLIYSIFIWFIIRDRWDKIFEMELNVLGDFLGGVFGPLGIILLVISIFQQKKELEQNTEALKLQSYELKNLVKQGKGISKINLDTLNYEKEKAKNVMLPKFVLLSIKDFYSRHGVLEKNLDITNIRTTVTNVNITSSVKKMGIYHVTNQMVSKSEYKYKQNIYIPIWGKDDEKIFCIKCEEMQLPHKFDIRIQYKLFDGKEHEILIPMQKIIKKNKRDITIREEESGIEG